MFTRRMEYKRVATHLQLPSKDRRVSLGVEPDWSIRGERRRPHRHSFPAPGECEPRGEYYNPAEGGAQEIPGPSPVRLPLGASACDWWHPLWHSRSSPSGGSWPRSGPLPLWPDWLARTCPPLPLGHLLACTVHWSCLVAHCPKTHGWWYCTVRCHCSCRRVQDSGGVPAVPLARGSWMDSRSSWLAVSSSFFQEAILIYTRSMQCTCWLQNAPSACSKYKNYKCPSFFLLASVLETHHAERQERESLCCVRCVTD